MTKLIYAIGPSYSGKSYYGKHLVEKGFVVVSSDKIREELYGNESIQGNPAEVFQIAHKRALEFLQKGKSVYFDSTGLKATHRIQFLEYIKKVDCEKECVIFLVSNDILQQRHALRERKVPWSVVEKQHQSFQIPCYGEGWDKISRVREGEYSLIDKLYHCIDEPHDNPHHDYTIGNHMVEAARLAIVYKTNEHVRRAALWHDIGKPFSKVWYNAKGEASDVAHYYHHENLGAYYYALGSQDVDWLEVANLIQWHMALYIYGDKKLKALEKRLGEKLWNDLQMLHKCDLEAH